MGLQTGPHLLLLLLLLGILAFVQRSQGLDCIPCSDTVCDPPKPVNCKWGTQKDVCGCCLVCAKGPGEECGGPWFVRGRCAMGFRCLQRVKSEGFCIWVRKPKASFH
ncbi:single insulin-like growth factor-binding domain protein-2 isoform X2 [Oratosquilla oratoria]|uniref:single insulin-like growth factor-binding domain protein-2 isoform X2 n=1 Tax=Oratosquilla oratoria TaxID=337810 RepID=UPI003F76B64A